MPPTPSGLSGQPGRQLVAGGVLALAIILFEIRITPAESQNADRRADRLHTGIIGATLISLVLSRMTAIPAAGTFLQVLIIMLMAYVGLIVAPTRATC